MSAVVFATADAVSTVATVVLPVVVVPALDRTTAFPVAVVHVAPTAVDATVIEAVATMIKVVAVVVDVVVVVVIVVAAVIIFDDTVIVVAATVVVTVVTVFDNVIAVIPAAVVVVIVDVADAVIYAVATTTTDERRWSFAVYVREATA